MSLPDNAELMAVTLRISSQDRTPDEISQAIGISPTKSFAKGSQLGRITKAKLMNNVWLFESQSDEKSIDARLNWLASKCGPSSSKIADLVSKGDLVDIFVGYDLTGDNASIELDRTSIKFVAAIDAELIFDLYI